MFDEVENVKQDKQIFTINNYLINYILQQKD